MYKLISAVPTDQYGVVVMTSGGGSAASAAKITEYFNRYNKPIRIEEYCASACADIMFMGAKSVTVSDRALVLFHYTSSYVYDSYRFGGGKSPAAVSRFEAEAETAFYKKVGLDVSFLNKVAFSGWPICVDAVPGQPDETYEAYHIDWVVPTRKQIEAYRGTFSGYWPSSAAEVGEILASQNMIAKGHTIKFEMLDSYKFAPLCGGQPSGPTN